MLLKFVKIGRFTTIPTYCLPIKNVHEFWYGNKGQYVYLLWFKKKHLLKWLWYVDMSLNSEII